MLIHCTLVPAMMVNICGEKAKFWIVTVRAPLLLVPVEAGLTGIATTVGTDEDGGTAGMAGMVAMAMALVTVMVPVIMGWIWQ